MKRETTIVRYVDNKQSRMLNSHHVRTVIYKTTYEGLGKVLQTGFRYFDTHSPSNRKARCTLAHTDHKLPRSDIGAPKCRTAGNTVQVWETPSVTGWADL